MIAFRFGLAAILLSLLLPPLPAQEKIEKIEPKAKPKFELKDGDRVVFLGNTFIERMQRYGYVEAALTARFPDADVTFRNLGWSGDTVWAESRGIFDPPARGYQRMLEHVKRLQPTVIFLGYGNNEAHAGKPGLPRFIKQYEKLLNDLTKVSAKGVRFVILSPIPYEDQGKPLPRPNAYNQDVKVYADAIESLARERGSRFIDLFEYVQKVNSIRILLEKGRTDLLRPPPFLTNNGMHLTPFGYGQLSGMIFSGLELHLGDDLSVAMLDAEKEVAFADRVKIDKVTAAPGKLTFDMKYQCLPSGDAIVDDVALRVRNLPKGLYLLKADGKPVTPGMTAHAWAIGRKVVDDPNVRQFERLRRAIIEKNQLYFHRWRPQNVTYLYLFRKHEQGNNAKEVLEFDKLVAEKERQIAKLRKPVPHKYELVRVKEEKK